MVPTQECQSLKHDTTGLWDSLTTDDGTVVFSGLRGVEYIEIHNGLLCVVSDPTVNVIIYYDVGLITFEILDLLITMLKENKLSLAIRN